MFSKLRRIWQDAYTLKTVFPLVNSCEEYESRGVKFLLQGVDPEYLEESKRVAEGLNHEDPFLEKNLVPENYVQDLDTHRIILNHFPARRDHMLIVTKECRHQTELLNISDFKAITTIFENIPCLIYFNNGINSGASQGHKHCQAIPIVDISNIPVQDTTLEIDNTIKCGLPIDEIINKYRDNNNEIGKSFKIKEFHFKHAICFHGIKVPTSNIDITANTLFEIYDKLMKEADKGIEKEKDSEGKEEEISHNFLLTPDWMMVVPRKCARYNGIIANSLEFAGICNWRFVEAMKEADPFGIIEGVTYPE